MQQANGGYIIVKNHGLPYFTFDVIEAVDGVGAISYPPVETPEWLVNSLKNAGRSVGMAVHTDLSPLGAITTILPPDWVRDSVIVALAELLAVMMTEGE